MCISRVPIEFEIWSLQSENIILSAIFRWFYNKTTFDFYSMYKIIYSVVLEFQISYESNFKHLTPKYNIKLSNFISYNLFLHLMFLRQVHHNYYNIFYKGIFYIKKIWIKQKNIFLLNYSTSDVANKVYLLKLALRVVTHHDDGSPHSPYYLCYP